MQWCVPPEPARRAAPLAVLLQEARFLRKCLLSAGRSEALVKEFRSDLVVITGVTRNAARLVVKLSKRGMIASFLLAGYAGAELRETLAMLHDKAHKLSIAMTVTMPDEIKLRLTSALGDATKGFERMANRMARGVERAALIGASATRAPPASSRRTFCCLPPRRQGGRRRRDLRQPCPCDVERPARRRGLRRRLRRRPLFQRG